MDYIVTYDIDTTNEEGVRRLALIAKICESYGQRAQYSVFECRLSDTMLARLTVAIQEAIEPDRDSVNLYRLEGGCRQARTTLGRQGWRSLGDPWIV